MKKVQRILNLLFVLLFLFPGFGTAEEPARPQIVLAQAYGAIVYVETNEPVSQYCIVTKDIIPDEDHPDWRPCEGRSFTAFKMDGSYYIRVKREDGAVSEPAYVTVSTSFHYGLEAENVKPLNTPILNLLEKNGDSLDAFNAEIAKSAVEGGLYSRAAVANVCMTLLTRLYKYGMTLSYQPSGNFTKAGDWGISPGWGTKMNKKEKDKAGTYDRYSMNCGTIIVWAYKQAGLNLNSNARRDGIYDSALKKRRGDNNISLNDGDTGDIIAMKTGHTILVLDRVDTNGDGLSDSYLVFEMESPYLKLKMRSLYSIRMCKMYDMSAMFSDTGALRKETRYWPGSFYISESEFPAYYQEAYTAELPRFAIRQALCAIENPS